MMSRLVRDASACMYCDRGLPTLVHRGRVSHMPDEFIIVDCGNATASTRVDVDLTEAAIDRSQAMIELLLGPEIADEDPDPRLDEENATNG